MHNIVVINLTGDYLWEGVAVLPASTGIHTLRTSAAVTGPQHIRTHNHVLGCVKWLPRAFN